MRTSIIHQAWRIPRACAVQHLRPFTISASLRIPYQDPNPDPSPDVVPDRPGATGGSDSRGSRSDWKSTTWKMFESAATTAASLAILGVAGYSYHLYYKSLVLRKMDIAFAPGDPVLDLAAPTPSSKNLVTVDGDIARDNSAEGWFHQPEQHVIDQIMDGTKKGRYYLLIGEKGTGKSSMIIEGMRKVDGKGISMFDAHADLEIFRVRLGKALNYEYHEDYIGSLFSVRGPRDTTALLDIERAFNKVEKIALKRRQKRMSPLVLVINSTHLIRDDADGRDLLELIQQRAEQWAASNLVTFVLNSDDYWVYERLKSLATRMEVITVRDLPKREAMNALAAYRTRYFPEHPVDKGILSQVYDLVGGRMNFLSRVAKSHDMLAMCNTILQNEKTWFLNQCGILGEEMDDDVMDQQKFASCAMVLAHALVQESEKMTTYDDEVGHILPCFPLHIARQIMTRADFIQQYDHENIFTIDSSANVRADSVPMMNAFKEICAQPGFKKYLDDTLDRISAIESLNRTRELTFKDLWIEQSGDIRGAYEAITRDWKGREVSKTEFRVKPDPVPEDDDDDGGEDDHKNDKDDK